MEGGEERLGAAVDFDQDGEGQWLLVADLEMPGLDEERAAAVHVAQELDQDVAVDERIAGTGMAAVEAAVVARVGSEALGSKVDFAELTARVAVGSPAGVARIDLAAMLEIVQIDVAALILVVVCILLLVIGAIMEIYRSATCQTLDFAAGLPMLEFALASWTPKTYFDAVAFPQLASFRRPFRPCFACRVEGWPPAQPHPKQFADALLLQCAFWRIPDFLAYDFSSPLLPSFLLLARACVLRQRHPALKPGSVACPSLQRKRDPSVSVQFFRPWLC